MAEPAADGLFGSDLWRPALEKYGSATHLTLRLFNADARAVFGPVYPTPLFQLFDEGGHHPGLCVECARRCLAQTAQRPPVIVSQFHGLSVVGTSLALEGRIVGAAVGGYALANFSQMSEIQRLAHESGIVFKRLWAIVRKQPPVPRSRLVVHGELLQVLGDALLREQYRTSQYEQAAAIVDSSGDAIFSQDLDGIITSWNRGAEQLYGYTEGEAIGRPIAILIPADRLDAEAGILERVRRGEKIGQYETARRRKDGTPLDVSLTISPLADGNGRIVGISKIARDITWLKRAEQHRELLVNELNHRVKNTLVTVQFLAMQTLRNSATLTEARDSFEARLAALAKAHDVLTQQEWEGASVDQVVADAVAAYSGDMQGPRFHVAGPFVRLRPKAVLALSMALHELATNALKYGALSNGTGKVEIDWRLTPGDRQGFRFCWAESGGPPVAAPRRRGFGSRLIGQALARDFAGEVRLNFAPAGVVCNIDVPLDEIGWGELAERFSSDAGSNR